MISELVFVLSIDRNISLTATGSAAIVKRALSADIAGACAHTKSHRVKISKDKFFVEKKFGLFQICIIDKTFPSNTLIHHRVEQTYFRSNQ